MRGLVLFAVERERSASQVGVSAAVSFTISCHAANHEVEQKPIPGVRMGVEHGQFVLGVRHHLLFMELRIFLFLEQSGDAILF